MAMVTLEARVMMKIGDASKLEGIQTVTDTPIVDSDEAQMMGLWAMGFELGARSDKARNSGSWKRRGEELKKLGTTQED